MAEAHTWERGYTRECVTWSGSLNHVWSVYQAAFFFRFRINVHVRGCLNIWPPQRSAWRKVKIMLLELALPHKEADLCANNNCEIVLSRSFKFFILRLLNIIYIFRGCFFNVVREENKVYRLSSVLSHAANMNRDLHNLWAVIDSLFEFVQEAI